MMTMEETEAYLVDSYAIYEKLPEQDRHNSPEYHVYGMAYQVWSACDSVPEVLDNLEHLKQDMAHEFDPLTGNRPGDIHPDVLKEFLAWVQIIIDTIKGEGEETPQP